MGVSELNDFYDVASAKYIWQEFYVTFLKN